MWPDVHTYTYAYVAVYDCLQPCAIITIYIEQIRILKSSKVKLVLHREIRRVCVDYMVYMYAE